MENQNFVNYYIETLISTMSDAIVRNVSLQANIKVNEEVINEQQKRIQEMQESFDSKVNVENDLKKAKEDLSDTENNYNALKHQIAHLDTFKNELSKEREEHNKTRKNSEDRITKITVDFVQQLKTLQDKIDYLQLSPAKRKKLDELKVETKPVLNLSSVTSKKKTLEIIPMEQAELIQVEDNDTF
jgi:predicted  nucleic acid-binding Zn-ribbon protein